jgi:PAS domain S-box-containing protein
MDAAAMLRTFFQSPANSPAVAAASPPAWSAFGATIATLLVCAGYYASGAAAIALRFEPGGISGIWLPNGILVAALLIAPVRRWWLYAVALLPTHLHVVTSFQGSVPLTVMLVQYGGSLGQAVIAAAALRRAVGQPPRLDSMSRMGAFLAVAAFLVPLVFSALVASLFVATGWVDDFLIAWQRRFFAVMCGTVIIAAPIVHLTTGGLAEVRRAPPRRIVEFMLVTAGLIAALLVPFAWEPARSHHQWLLFVPLPLLLWSAVRFGPAGLGVHLLAVAVVTLLNTKAGRGSFVAGSAAENVLALQVFFLAISIPLMLLAALVRQHAQAAASLHQSQAQYRSVVEDQTELICRFRADGTYTFVNRPYCRYFERSSPDELIGQQFWQFLPESAQAPTRAHLASITPDHPVRTIEHQVMGPAGELRWQQWTDRGFFDRRGRIIEYQAVGRDITERKRAEEAVKQSANLLRLFVQHAPAAVAMFDRDMKYLIYSQRWLTDYSLGDQDLFGRSHYEVFPEIPERWKEIHRRCLAGAVEVQEDDSFVRADGSTDWLRWEVRPWHDAQDRIGGIIMFTEVITERMRAEEEHRQLVAQTQVAEALREVDRRKDEFLAVLAHELRNPLSPIVMGAEMIRIREPADDAINWARDVIARQAAQLTRLVDDLLDVSRITLGKMTLDLSALDLGPVIAQAVEATQPLFTARGHEFSIDVPDHPLPIRGDGARLTQIISNLLNNAAKFTDRGGRIRLGVRQIGSDVVLRIADNGRGIPAHMLERVFDMFTQLERPADRVQDGLGIGLALVKRLVEMHHGEIEARSDGPGRGCEFVVRLPMAIALEAGDAPPAGAAGGDPSPQRPRPERILVVDDNVDAAESLCRILRLQQHEVLVAHDGLAALAAARDMNPDVVLLDIGLPKLDGLEVARRLREGGEGPGPLLVAMTGFGQAADRARTAAAGFDHHLTKPVDPQVLRSLIRTVRSHQI